MNNSDAKNLLKWNTQKANWENFKTLALSKLETQIDSQENIDDLVEDFTNHIKYAAEQLTEYKKKT